MLPPLPHLGGSWRIFEDLSVDATIFLERKNFMTRKEIHKKAWDRYLRAYELRKSGKKLREVGEELNVRNPSRLIAIGKTITEWHQRTGG